MSVRPPHPQITPHELSMRTDRHVVLDVREPREWLAGHIDGAVHIPMSELCARLEQLDADTPIVTVCRSGRRSDEVADALTSRGYHAANLAGGLQAWLRAGLPLKGADGRAGEVL